MKIDNGYAFVVNDAVDVPAIAQMYGDALLIIALIIRRSENAALMPVSETKCSVPVLKTIVTQLCTTLKIDALTIRDVSDQDAHARDFYEALLGDSVSRCDLVISTCSTNCIEAFVQKLGSEQFHRQKSLFIEFKQLHLDEAAHHSIASLLHAFTDYWNCEKVQEICAVLGLEASLQYLAPYLRINRSFDKISLRFMDLPPLLEKQACVAKAHSKGRLFVECRFV